MILISGSNVVLRDRLPSDVERYLHWQTHGAWRYYDAPWEGIDEKLEPQQVVEIRATFLEKCQQTPPIPRQQVILATRDENQPLGWLNRYSNERFPGVAYLGIDICEDDFLGRGLGTEALRLWCMYLFAEGDYHKLELHTWCINPRMIRVAEKLGFQLEGRERELLQWQGQWLDRLSFGLLRREWCGK